MNNLNVVKSVEKQPKAKVFRSRTAPITLLPSFADMIRKVELLQKDNLYFYMRPLESASAGSIFASGQRMIMLGSNNYLGLTTHPKVKKAAIQAIEKYGTGAGGVRILSGTYRIHEELEEKLAEFKGTESAIIYSSGYVMNVAAMSTFGELGYVLINDEKNHASIIDGCKVRNAHVRFYKHNNMDSLEKVLSLDPSDVPRIIAADGVFSMDGDIADLPGIVSLASKYNSKIYIDDAHATGVIGDTGRGTAEYYGLEGKVDIYVGTLSKALGAVGGFVAGPKSLTTYLKHASRAFVFASALPPSVAATVLTSLEVIKSEPEHLERLRNNTRTLVEGLVDLGYDVKYSGTPIVPVIVGEELNAYRLTRALHNEGVFVCPVAHPAVKPKESRIRISVNAALSAKEIDCALGAFYRAGKTLKLI